MGSKTYYRKEVKWIINFVKSQLDSLNDREDDTSGDKSPDSSEKEENNGKRQSSKKGNPALTHKSRANERQKN